MCVRVSVLMLSFVFFAVAAAYDVVSSFLLTLVLLLMSMLHVISLVGGHSVGGTGLVVYCVGVAGVYCIPGDDCVGG